MKPQEFDLIVMGGGSGGLAVYAAYQVAQEVDDEILEALRESDRARVAMMQVKQARKTAELAHRSLKEQLVSG